MHDFVRNMIKFRHEHRYAFAPGDYGESAPFTWKNPSNFDQSGDDWNTKRLMQHYHDASAGEEIVILINMENQDVEFTLPGGRTWKRVVDTQKFFDTDSYVEGQGMEKTKTANFSADGPILDATYVATPQSMVIAVAVTE